MYADQPGCKVRLRNAHHTIYLLTGEKSIHLYGEKGDTVSVIPITEKIHGVTIEGCRWEIEDSDIFRGQSRGISNCLENKEARISAQDGMAFVFHIHDLPS